MTKALLMMLALVLSAHAAASEIEAHARTDTTEYLVGDWIAVGVELHHPPGATFQMLVGDSLGPYRVLDRQAIEPVDSTETRTAIVVARYDSGTVALPPLEFLASVPGDTTLYRVATAPLVLTVHTLPVAATDSLRALKDPLSIPYTLGEILAAIAILAVLVAGGLLLYRYFKRRSPPALVPAEPRPERPPHLVALEELGAVRAKRLWQQGRAKEYHTEVTEVLRRYFERRFAVPALEETTEEILHGLHGAGLREEVLETVGGVLRRADLVKFATYNPSPEEHEETMSSSVAVVERTRPPVASPKQPAAEHVGT